DVSDQQKAEFILCIASLHDQRTDVPRLHPVERLLHHGETLDPLRVARHDFPYRQEKGLAHISSPIFLASARICDDKPTASSIAICIAMPEPGSASNPAASAIPSRIELLRCASTTRRTILRWRERSRPRKV